jgi:hypothetical protein
MAGADHHGLFAGPSAFAAGRDVTASVTQKMA